MGGIRRCKVARPRARLAKHDARVPACGRPAPRGRARTTPEYAEQICGSALGRAADSSICGAGRSRACSSSCASSRHDKSRSALFRTRRVGSRSCSTSWARPHHSTEVIVASGRLGIDRTRPTHLPARSGNALAFVARRDRARHGDAWEADVIGARNLPARHAIWFAPSDERALPHGVVACHDARASFVARFAQKLWFLALS